MSNRQARRDQMRTTRTQRAQQRPGSPQRPTRGSGGSRGGGGGLFSRMLAQPFLLIVAGVIIIGAVVLGLLLAQKSGGDEDFVNALNTAEANFPYDMTDGNKVGSDDAPVKLTQFEDFQCPFCLQYTSEEEPTLIEEYVKSGKVQIIFENLTILGTESARAARAGECVAEQDKFWEFHNKLFLVQAEAGQYGNEQTQVGRFADDKLRQYAGEAGADLAVYDTCMGSEASLAKVQADQQAASQFGIRSTPSFLINGVPVSGAPADVEGWREFLDEQIELAENPTATPTGSATATGTTTPSATASGTPSPSATTTATGSATP